MHILKFFIFSAATLFVSNVFAQPRTVIMKNAYVIVCGQVPGCAPRIYQEDNPESDFLLDPRYVKSFLESHKVDGNLSSHVLVREALGVVVKEKGHSPNPSIEFEVFKAISLFE